MCPAPRTPPHGRWVQEDGTTTPNNETHAVDTVLRLQCNRGYQGVPGTLFGLPTITCTVGMDVFGQRDPISWASLGDFPHCIISNKTMCPDPPADDHGKWSPGGGGAYPEGGIVHLLCDTGYEPSTDISEAVAQADQMVCSAEGTWAFEGTTLPQCLLSVTQQPHGYCNGVPLSTVNHGNWVVPIIFSQPETFVTGETTTLHCDEGYRQSGFGTHSDGPVSGSDDTLAVLRCEADGWTAPPPPVTNPFVPPTPPSPATCVEEAPAQGCPFLQGVDFGSWSAPQNIFAGYQTGDHATLSCESGYTISVAAASVTCSDAGEWVGSVGARCVPAAPSPPSGCVEPMAPPDGTWSLPWHPHLDGEYIYSEGEASSLSCVAGSTAQPPDATVTCVLNPFAGEWVWTGDTGAYCTAAPAPQPAPQCTSCTNADELQTCSDAVTNECCDEPSEDCSSGEPASCNSGCAAVLVPMQEACDDYLKSGPYLAPVRNALASAADNCPPNLPPIAPGECAELAQYLEYLAEMSDTCCTTPVDMFGQHTSSCVGGYPSGVCSPECTAQVSRLHVGCEGFLESSLGKQMAPMLVSSMHVCGAASGGH